MSCLWVVLVFLLASVSFLAGFCAARMFEGIE